MYPIARALEKKSEFINRFLNDKDVKENIAGNFRIKEANKVWNLSWDSAEVTVISSQGDFFINR